MILARARTLLAALGGTSIDHGLLARFDGRAKLAADPRLATIVRALASAGPSASAIADAIVAGLEPVVRERPTRKTTWIFATTAAATIAAISASIGLTSIFHFLRPTSFPRLSLLPLVVVPIAARIVWTNAARHRAAAQEDALTFSVPLLRLGIAPALAVDAASWLAGLDEAGRDSVLASISGDAGEPTLVRAVRLRAAEAVSAAYEGGGLRGTLAPAAIATWVVCSFWALYFFAIAHEAIGRGLDP